MRKILFILLLASCNKDAQSPYFTEAVPPTPTATYAQIAADYTTNRQNEQWALQELNGYKNILSYYLTNAPAQERKRNTYDSLVKAYSAVSINIGGVRHAKISGKYIDGIDESDATILIRLQK